MEDKKFDLNSIIGFVLIFGILIYIMYQNKPSEEEIAAQKKAEQEQVEAEKKAEQQKDTLVTTANDYANTVVSDSIQKVALKNQLGAFAYTMNASVSQQDVTVETDSLLLKFNRKGGYLSEVKLKGYTDYNADPIYLVKDGNTGFNINFGTTDNRILNTKDLVFEPSVTKSGTNTVVSMKLKVSEAQYLEYRYELKKDDYLIDFSVKSQDLKNVFNTSQTIKLDWEHKAYRHAKSISYENRYTDIHYEFEDGKADYMGGKGDDTEDLTDVTWIGYKQHFFSSILLTDKAFKTAKVEAKNLVEDEAIDTVYTKSFKSEIPLEFTGGELSYNMDLYYGPNKFKKLSAYDRNLDEIVPLGWGIFGWINRYLFMPLFNFLGGFLPYGIAIIVMTILVKILLSFVQYKQFLSQAKMKILKPELEAIRKKHKNDKMKAQQETMALQSKAGASPLSGCLPGLLQIPVFYALFQFFPSAFNLRQQSFLWADDLSSYDAIIQLPFRIPFYGDHVSLFPLLAAIAIFFYMKMTTGQQTNMQPPAQEGMPDMSKMMKYMIYFSPLLMLVFFNNYASGLSLYYFISNLISIGIMLVIKNYIIDEEKVLAKIESNKSKPKKENRFQRKMKEMMEQAEQQKKAQERKKK